MKKVFYLETCKTCQKIMAELPLDDFVKREIKSQGISETDLAEMRQRTDSYESLFSRRAMKFRQWGLHEKTLTEDDYRDLLLKEYTFLKRPVFIVDDALFAGNAKKNVEALKAALQA